MTLQHYASLAADNSAQLMVENMEQHPGQASTDGNFYSIAHLIRFGQALCHQENGQIELLCEEIRRITHGVIQLRPGQQNMIKKAALSIGVVTMLPVQFGDVSYGTLHITMSTQQLTLPEATLTFVQLLAQVCGLLLYTFEQTTFIRTQCKNLEYYVNGPLTKREREVLLLIYRGCNQDEIAETLHISPTTVSKHRQHIYEQLGVHNEYDARLAAYHIGLFSLWNEV